MTYPQDIPLPRHVPQERKRRLKELLGACLRGMLLRGLLIGIQFIGYWLYSSHALLMDALSSGVDLLSSLLLMICLWLAKSPPDYNHPFGHGRIEPIAGMLLGSFLIQFGFYFIWKLIHEFHTDGVIDPRAALFALAAAIVLEICYHLIRRYAKIHRSSAMAVEAVHYRMDALNSLIAFAALSLSTLFPIHGFYFDQGGAIVIAVAMIYLGYVSFKENFDQIVDKRPDEATFKLIEQAALDVEGVLGTEKIRIQQYGPDAHVDIDVEVDPLLPTFEAHHISQKVRRSIQSHWPAVLDVTVHIEPYFKDDHV